MGNSLIVSTIPGFAFNSSEKEHVRGFDTVLEAKEELRALEPCACEDCTKKLNTFTLSDPNVEPDEEGLAFIMREVAYDAMIRRKRADAKYRLKLFGRGVIRVESKNGSKTKK